MDYYFILNGPPSSGKSTFSNIAIRAFNLNPNITASSESFAAPIKGFMSNLLGVPYSSIDKSFPHPTLRLAGMYASETPRESLIALSETYCKKRYGDAFFGRALVSRCQRNLRSGKNLVFVVDDSGFQSEFNALPRDRTILVKVLRPGFSFSSDSRSYLPAADRILSNDSDLKKATSIVEDLVKYAIDKWRLS